MVSAHDRMLWRDLWHLRGQVAAAALVVAVGVAAFLSMRATYESLLRARDDYYRAYRFADVFAAVERAPAGLASRIAGIDGVAQVRTRIVAQVVLDVAGLDEPAVGRLVSIPDRPRPVINDLVLRAGRYVATERDDEVIASEAFASANSLRLGDSVGAVLDGRWRRLRVVGIALSPESIYELGGASLFPDNRRFGILWMAESALAAAYDMEGAFNDVSLTLTARASEGDVIERLDLLLARFGGRGAYGRTDHLSHRFITDEIAQNRVSSTFVPAIFLGVAAFLLHIVLSRLVALQRTEIGLLKAFGYANRDVGWHYFGFALVTIGAGLIVGAILGALAGGALTDVYREYYRFPRLEFEVSPATLVWTVVIAVAAAAAGALSPVRAAVGLPPAVAMRPEPPASYHAGLLEHTGFASRLPSSARMIGRSIVRRRWKSVLAVAALACAVGVVIVGRFSLDAIDEMMRVQFEVVQRDDATVVFARPESGAIRHDLARLPGVLAVEPFRVVAARLRHEHRNRRVDVTGLVAGSQLRRVVDSDLRPVQLPENGVVLTRMLAEVLHIVPGQSLVIEVLEGARPTRTVQVTALVDEPVGVGAYMDLGALHRLLREEGSLSGAYLAIDPLHSQQLYRELKRMPAIGGAAFRDAVLSSFEHILDRSVRWITVLNVVTACVIAFGVVYNGARIALSERGNELASLRVLGFTRREVTWLLLGEQGVLALVAVPFGFGLGVATAWVLVRQWNTELYRIPLALQGVTFSFAVIVVAIAAIVSGILVARRIGRLDLVAVLKTRE